MTRSPEAGGPPVEPCILCGETADVDRGTARCRACGLVYVTPPLDDAGSIELQTECRVHDESGRSDAFRLIESTARANRGGPGAALDVGCGAGAFMLVLRERGWSAVGIDINERALEQARARGLDVRMTTLAALVGGDERFDLVVFMHAVEYFARPLEALQQAAKLLTPGGTLVLETPNAPYHRLQARIGRLVHLGRDRVMRVEAEPGRRLLAFSAASGRLALDRSGLVDVGVRPSLPRTAGGPVERIVRRAIFDVGRLVYAATGGRAMLAPSMLVVGRRPSAS